MAEANHRDIIEESCEYTYQDFMIYNSMLWIEDYLDDVDYLAVSPSLPVCPPWYVHVLFASVARVHSISFVRNHVTC